MRHSLLHYGMDGFPDMNEPTRKGWLHRPLIQQWIKGSHKAKPTKYFVLPKPGLSEAMSVLANSIHLLIPTPAGPHYVKALRVLYQSIEESVRRQKVVVETSTGLHVRVNCATFFEFLFAH